MCRESQMGVAAAQRAIADAGLRPASTTRSARAWFSARITCSPCRTSFAAMRPMLPDEKTARFCALGHAGMPQFSPLWLLKYLPNMPASHIAIYNDLRGPNNSLTLREAAANLAVGEAFRMIHRGHADMMVAGATGTRVHPMKAVHALMQEEVAGNGPIRPGQPAVRFESRRHGAGRRGRRHHARRARIGPSSRCADLRRNRRRRSSSVVDRSGVAQRDQALANVMRGDLARRPATPADVGHVHAHGLRNAHLRRGRSLGDSRSVWPLGPAACR